MKLVDILQPDSICMDLKSTEKAAVLAELSAILAQNHPELKSDLAAKVLIDREGLATTGIGEGVAIPHGKVEGLSNIRIALGISRAGVAFDAVDQQAVQIFVALLAPSNASGGDHLRALARVSRLLKDSTVRDRMLAAETAQDIFDIIRDEDGKY